MTKNTRNHTRQYVHKQISECVNWQGYYTQATEQKRNAPLIGVTMTSKLHLDITNFVDQICDGLGHHQSIILLRDGCTAL
jgi:hypothetical protein